MENQRTIVTRIKNLCMARKYDEAYDLCKKIEIGEFEVRAYLLIVEHELNYKRSIKNA